MEVILWMVLKPLLATVATAATTWLMHKAAAYFTAKTGIAIDEALLKQAIAVVKQVEELALSGQSPAKGTQKTELATQLLKKAVPGLTSDKAFDLIRKAVAIEPCIGATGKTQCGPAPVGGGSAIVDPVAG